MPLAVPLMLPIIIILILLVLLLLLQFPLYENVPVKLAQVAFSG